MQVDEDLITRARDQSGTAGGDVENWIGNYITFARLLAQDGLTDDERREHRLFVRRCEMKLRTFVNTGHF